MCETSETLVTFTQHFFRYKTVLWKWAYAAPGLAYAGPRTANSAPGTAYVALGRYMQPPGRLTRPPEELLLMRPKERLTWKAYPAPGTAFPAF